MQITAYAGIAYEIVQSLNIGKRTFKKLILAVLLICIVAAQVPTGAYAQTSSKEKADVTISTAKQWNKFARQVTGGNDFSGKLVKLTKDIKFDQNTLLDFSPAGGNDKPFNGTFDGNGHTISGVFYEETAYYVSIIGLFVKVGSKGTIKNLTIENSSFKDHESNSGGRGMICGHLDGGTIENCHVNNSEINCGGGGAGGIVGINTGTVVNCSSNASVIVSGGSAGGIVGENGYGSIYNCFSSGKISTQGSGLFGWLGGIAGGDAFDIFDEGTEDKRSTVINCYSTCTFPGMDEGEGRCAGIVGVSCSGMIRNCYYDEGTASTVHNYYDEGTRTVTTNVKAISISEMAEESFVDELNKNRGSNSSWLKWELTGGTPTFAPLYEVTFNTTKNGYAKVNYGYANEGQTVTLTLVPNKKYKKSSVQVKTNSGKKITLSKKNSAGTKYTFTMPDDGIAVTAKFKKK